jgi:hypothetical protein
MLKRKHLRRAGSDDYRVGYCKPPVHSRFRPGQSGYPAGRRKGVRNLKTDVMRRLSTPIKVKEGGRTRTRSTQEGALMLLCEKAFRGGSLRALSCILELALRFNNDMAEVGPAAPLSADDRAILAAYVAEVTASKAGPPKPDPSEDRPRKPSQSKGKRPNE